MKGAGPQACGAYVVVQLDPSLVRLRPLVSIGEPDRLMSEGTRSPLSNPHPDPTLTPAGQRRSSVLPSIRGRTRPKFPITLTLAARLCNHTLPSNRVRAYRRRYLLILSGSVHTLRSILSRGC